MKIHKETSKFKFLQTRNNLFFLIILLIIVIISFMFIPFLFSKEKISVLQFSVLSNRIADYSENRFGLTFQPLSLDIIYDILYDKYPDATDLDERLEKIFDQLKASLTEEEPPSPPDPVPPDPEPDQESEPPVYKPIQIICGDSFLQAGEQCDDGNKMSGDGCSSSCVIEVCGNNVIDSGEYCEPPNGTTCDGNCQNIPIVCGNNILQPGEQCDDGNNVASDGCSASCTTEVCGNNTIDAGEQCDDGNTANGDGCSASCTTEVCGNNTIDAGEQCDDGNTTSGDGCSASCTTEVCGNNIVDSGEDCDDGNTADGDGCSASCTNEPLVVCTNASLGNFSQVNKFITWDITNNTGQNLVIKEINLDWPVGMVRLYKVTLDVKILWNGSDDTPPTIINSAWGGTTDDRTIGTGLIKEIEFAFDGNSVLTGYDLTISFDTINCYINFSN